MNQKTSPNTPNIMEAEQPQSTYGHPSKSMVVKDMLDLFPEDKSMFIWTPQWVKPIKELEDSRISNLPKYYESRTITIKEWEDRGDHGNGPACLHDTGSLGKSCPRVTEEE